MKKLAFTSLFFLVLCKPCIAIQDRALPWTPSFLSIRSDFSVDQFSANIHHLRSQSPRYQARYDLSSVPLEDWRVDAALMASSIKTPKIQIRAEKQFFCDLKGDSISLTGVAIGRLTTLDRAKNPVFFEMASRSVETGFGIGRHLQIKKEYYTQLFSYALVGIGTNSSRFGSLEIGLNHVFKKTHFFRASLEYLKTFPPHLHSFAGIATQRASALSAGLWYRYRFNTGIEVSIGYIKRWVRSKSLSSAVNYQLQVSIPISL